MSKQPLSSFSRRRIAIFEPNPDLATNPSLVCLLEALTGSGAHVDVFAPDSGGYPSMDDLADRYPFPRPFAFWHGRIRTTLGSWWKLAQAIRLFAVRGYDLVIGIDSAGVIRGCEFARLFHVPLAYLSFEIFFRDDLVSPSDIEEKQHECTASRFADLVIIQDQWRAQLLTAENGLSPDKLEYLPVSPGGPPVLRKSDYLRKRFNLSGSQTLVLHSGSLANWTCADELLANVATWPEGFVLIVHTRYKPNQNDTYIRAIDQAALPNVVLSAEPLRMDEYEQLVASADIGLVLYKSVRGSPHTGKNIQNIGLASGKFSSYMKCGLPVISLGQQSYAQLLAEYAFGENLDSLDEMPAALSRVRSNLDIHQAEAWRIFREKLDFGVYWPTLSARLLEIVK